MASIRSRGTTAIGSGPWISNERDQFNHITDQEIEEFAFSTQNEMQWLNEHMADIFSKDRIEVTEIFKTPGKLRGKTPRTARKRDALGSRLPLTDVFAPNTQKIPSSQRGLEILKQPPPFQLAEAASVPLKSEANRNRKAYGKGKENGDSGYHGMSSDDMEMDPIPQRPLPPPPEKFSSILYDSGVLRNNLSTHEDSGSIRTETRPTETSSPHITQMPVDEAYASQNTQPKVLAPASQVFASKVSSTQRTLDSAYGSQDTQATSQFTSRLSQHPLSQQSYGAPPSQKMVILPEDVNDKTAVDRGTEVIRSPSEGSSPVRPLVRKSSLTFASLPAREPLATKKSIGTRTSTANYQEQSKVNGGSRGSHLGRQASTKSSGGAPLGTDLEDEMDVDVEVAHSAKDLPEESDQETRMKSLHNKTSTQRLHEKINMLGQSQPSRPTKSIPSIANNSSLSLYPDLSQLSTENATSQQNEVRAINAFKGSKPEAALNSEDEDDWIPMKPPVPNATRARPPIATIKSVEVLENDNPHKADSALQIDQKSRDRRQEPLELANKQLRGGLRPGHMKAASTSIIASPTISALVPDSNHKKTISVSNPYLPSVVENGGHSHVSYTPIGSPTSRKHPDGPLSASKAKLSSIIRSARGMFASSAGLSAQAKMETLSPSSMKARNGDNIASINEALHGKSTTTLHKLNISADFVSSEVSRIPSPSRSSLRKEEGRRTRSSSEREEKRKEKEAKERQKVAEELEKARGKEAQKAAAYKLEKERVAAQEKKYLAQKKVEERTVKQNQSEKPTRKSPRRTKMQGEDELALDEVEALDQDLEMADANQRQGPTTNQSQGSSLIQKPKDRRPTRPAREPSTKAKPAPVSIRVGTASQRLQIGQSHPSTAHLASTLQTSLGPVPPPKPCGPVTKPSNNSLHTSASNVSLKSSASSTVGKPKALLAAAKKREQDEKEAQRKAEHKREMERKRAAQQEEDRRQEHQRRLDTERQQREKPAQLDESRKLAQKQTIEKRRLENAKKADQQRSLAERSQAKASVDLGNSTHQDRAHAPPLAHRGELGNARLVSKMSNAPNPREIQEDFTRSVNAPPINPARPPKRVFQAEPSEDQSHRQAARQGPPFEQNDAKRRRTNDECSEAPDSRQPMPPPVRQSSIRKDATNKTIFAHGYTTAPSNQAFPHVATSLLKSTTMNQHHINHSKPVHPMDMAKFSSAKIPFAENPNGAGPHKTPIRPVTASAKSSPRYQNGEAIELPEIATDSEDDDEDEFAVPDWANSPELRKLLEDQQLVDPEQVFGPMATLHMEEIFRNKDRHHRFRSRTSSANWSGQDRLTQEEIIRDAEARERLRANGGWTYGLTDSGKKGRP